MKSYGGLWSEITSHENLLLAWDKFRRNHPTDSPTLKYARNLEGRLNRTRRLLKAGKWRASDYYQFMVYEPKPRMISAVPVEDRVVHHALCNVIGPLMEKSFIDQSFACRDGKGSHKAQLRARELAREFMHGFYLKMDVRHYFESVNHGILLEMLDKRFREREVRSLYREIVLHPIPRHKPGIALPIGNLTSQWFANLYLDGLDHFIVDRLGTGRRYLRYMDDMLVFCRDKADAWRIHDAVKEYLKENLNLELKEKATIVSPVSEGVPFLGLRIWPNEWRMTRSRWIRTRRSARKYIKGLYAGTIAEEKVQQVLMSMEGTARWYGFKNVYRDVGEPEERRRAKKERGKFLELWASGDFVPSAPLASSAAEAPTPTMTSRGTAQARAIATTDRPTPTGTSASALPAFAPNLTILPKGTNPIPNVRCFAGGPAETKMQQGAPGLVRAAAEEASRCAQGPGCAQSSEETGTNRKDLKGETWK